MHVPVQATALQGISSFRDLARVVVLHQRLSGCSADELRMETDAQRRFLVVC